MEKPEQPKQNSREWRLIGNASEESKARVEKSFNKKLFDHWGNATEKEKEDMRKIEIIKTPEQVDLINLANKETNQLMARLGYGPIDVSPENIHLLDDKVFTKFGKENQSGLTVYDEQGILIRASFFEKVQGLASFYSTIFHEMMHLKAHVSLEVRDVNEKSSDASFFRVGVNIYSSHKKNKERLSHSHFRGLNEAIVALAEQKEYRKQLEQRFDDEKRWLETTFARSVKEDARAIKDQDAITVQRKEVSRDGVPRTEIYAVDISYPRHTELLKYLMEQIKEDNDGKFSSEDAVFDVFLKAHFSGQILEIARLVERSFGEGGFRYLGDMTPDGESAIKTLEGLKKMRAKVLRER